jgi:long-chain acyl-CoA synthetase
VIGVPNEEFGEEVKAIVAVAEGEVADAALAEEVRGYYRAQLAGYKVPRSIDFVDELPSTGTGKIQKSKLREPYWVGRERQI